MKRSEQRRPTIGIALSGGAARGFAHIGALKVLQQEKIPIDFIMGASVGSIIGAAFAGGTPFETMLEICSTMRWRDIARIALSKRGLASIDRSDVFLNRLIQARTFEELAVPFYAVTTDIRTGETIVLSHGELMPALHASCAIPGLFVPVQIQGRSLVDGGVSANLPVLPLKQLGAEKVVLIDVSARIDERRPPQNIVQIMLQSMFIIGRSAARLARQQADVIVEPDINSYEWDDFKHCPEISLAGEMAMRRALPQILDWLPPRKKSFFQKIRAVFHQAASA